MKKKSEKKSSKKKYVIIRSHSAGVFAGYLKSQSADGKRVVLNEARRLWYWKGAASLSQLAVDGVKYPNECKFPVAVPEHETTDVCEVLPVSEKARASIASVPVWSA